jgi:hypothetical protein
VQGYACGEKYVSYDWRDPHGRRAVVLGFPPDSFVVSKDDFPVDWQAMMREAEVELANLPPGVTELPEEVKDALYARALARRDLANRS